MKIICYGNCQVGAVAQYLKNLNLRNIQINHYPCYSMDTSDTQINILYNDLRTADVLITQPINDNYRSCTKLSTRAIINSCERYVKIIMIQSYHFEFYYPDLTYLFKNGKLLQKPMDYHYKNIIKCYNEGRTVEECIEQIEDPNLFSIDYYETIAKNSLGELKRRYDVLVANFGTNDSIHIINVIDYIENNYKNKLLFHSMNHPTKYLLVEIMKKIYIILDINLVLLDTQNDYIDNTKCILYNSLQNCVHFNVKEHKPLMNGSLVLRTIIQMYYDAYSDTTNRMFLME